LNGDGHCSYGYGTVSRLKNRLPRVEVRIVIMPESGDVELTPEMEKVRQGNRDHALADA